MIKQKNKKSVYIALGLLSVASMTAAVSVFTDIALIPGNATPNTVTGQSFVSGSSSKAQDNSIAFGLDQDAELLSFTIGVNNTARTASMAIGAHNTVNNGPGDTRDSEAFVGGAIGISNEISGKSSFVVGFQNQIFAQQSVVLGKGLLSTNNDATVVGRYNEDIDETLFTVGSGASGTNRRNAFYIKNNGDVVIPKLQGDISMGIFGQ